MGDAFDNVQKRARSAIAEHQDNILKPLRRAHQEAEAKVPFDRQAVQRGVELFLTSRDISAMGRKASPTRATRHKQATSLEERLAAAGKSIRQAMKDPELALAVRSAWIEDKLKGVRSAIESLMDPRYDVRRLEAEFQRIVDGIRELEKAAYSVAQNTRVRRGGQLDNGVIANGEIEWLAQVFRHVTGAVPSRGRDGLFAQFVEACYEAAGCAVARPTIASRAQDAHRDNPRLFT